MPFVHHKLRNPSYRESVISHFIPTGLYQSERSRTTLLVGSSYERDDCVYPIQSNKEATREHVYTVLD